MLTQFKSLLTRIGARLPARAIAQVFSFGNYLWVGHWLRAHGYRVPPRLASREQVFRRIADAVEGSGVLYLEFGVFKGESMRLWCGLLRDPGAQLYGFDTFDGLPERWLVVEGAGSYSAEGKLPHFDDPRVQLRKGLFQDTLAGFVPPPHQQLVVNLDADLYSSTKTVLQALRPSILPGTVLYFDEFCNAEHELKAFEEFSQGSGMTFELLAADRTLAAVAFKRIA